MGGLAVYVWQQASFDGSLDIEHLIPYRTSDPRGLIEGENSHGKILYWKVKVSLCTFDPGHKSDVVGVVGERFTGHAGYGGVRWLQRGCAAVHRPRRTAHLLSIFGTEECDHCSQL